jgi:hypothetical protein
VELVKRAALSDRRLRENAMPALDAAGRSTNLTLWNHPGDDVYGMVALPSVGRRHGTAA